MQIKLKNLLSENMRRFGTKNLNENEQSREFVIDDWDIVDKPEFILGKHNAEMADEWLELFTDLPENAPDQEFIEIANEFLEEIGSNYRCVGKISQNEEGEITWKMKKK